MSKVIPTFMPVTVKGQVTIPKRIRDHLQVRPGDRLTFEVDAAGAVIVRKAEAPAATIDRFGPLIGSGSALKGMSTDEIMLLLRGEFEEL